MQDVSDKEDNQYQGKEDEQTKVEQAPQEDADDFQTEEDNEPQKTKEIEKDQETDQDNQDQGKEEEQTKVEQAPQEDADVFQTKEDNEPQKTKEIEKDQETNQESFKGSLNESNKDIDQESDDESGQEDNKNVQKIKWKITKPLDRAGSGIYFYDEEEDQESEKKTSEEKDLVKQEMPQESDDNQQTPDASNQNLPVQNGKYANEKRSEQQQQSQATQSQNQLAIIIDPKLPQNQQKKEQAQKLESLSQDDDGLRQEVTDQQIKDIQVDEQQKSLDEQEQEDTQKKLNLPKQQDEQIVVLSQSQAPIQSVIQPVHQQIIQVRQQVSQAHQGIVQSSAPPANFQGQADQEKSQENDEQQAMTQLIDAQFQVPTQKVTDFQSHQKDLPQKLMLESQPENQLQEQEFPYDKIQINNNDIERLKNNNNDILNFAPDFDQETSKTQEQLFIQQKCQKQDKQIAEQSQQASSISLPHQTRQEQLQPNILASRFQSQIPSVHETKPINLIQAEQDQKYNDSQQKSPIKSQTIVSQFNKDDGNVSKDLDTTPPNQENHSEDKNSILNSVPHSPQKMHFKEGQNHQDIKLDMVEDLNLNSEGNKSEQQYSYEEEDKQEMKMENRESKLASADQIFIDEDDLKSQNNKRPSDFLHQNGKAPDGLVGLKLQASSGYQNRSPITTDDSPDKIWYPEDNKKKASQKSKRMDIDIQGKGVVRPSREGGCCGSCKIL